MGAQPKRKHSTQRTGKRRAAFVRHFLRMAQRKINQLKKDENAA